MESNTARQLSATQVIKEFQDAHSNLDLLKVFLITGSADISRSYEFIRKLIPNAKNDADKAKFNNALKTLENIELKRIELTELIYSANTVQIIPISESKPDKTTISMFPTLDSILERVKYLVNEKTESLSVNITQAYDLLKSSVGQGKVLNVEGKVAKWSDKQIKEYMNSIIPVDDTIKLEEIETTDKLEVNNTEKIEFTKVYDHFMEMIENGKVEPEIKQSVKSLIMNKLIGGIDAKNDYFIKDETIFEDYYKRMLENVIVHSIIAFNNKDKSATSKTETADNEVKKVVIPLLKELDKDEKVSNFTSATRKFRDIYTNLGLNVTLSDALLKVKEIAVNIAPNLISRNKGVSKSNVPLGPTEFVKLVNEKKAERESDEEAIKSIEIYDETHNIKESNKDLWDEVKDYEFLNQIFDKAKELSKIGQWRDALSMCIILISSGQIRESKNIPKKILWNTDEIKLWYFNTVEEIEEQQETIDVKAEIVKDEPEKKADETVAESNEPSQKSKKETKAAQQGPVPQAGSLDSKVLISRVLKDPSLWKDTYEFKPFFVKTDHHRGGGMSLEIVNASEEQEKDLLITEVNMTKFFDEMRDQLIASANDYPKVKMEIEKRLTPFYELSLSEIKRITSNLAKEAGELRKESKKVKDEVNKETSIPTPPETNVPETKVPETEVPKTDVPDTTKKEEPDKSEDKPELETVITLLEETDKPDESNKETDPPDSPPDDAPEVEEEENSENTSGEDSISSNENEISYKGFEAILKAKGKHDMNVAISDKAKEYATSEEGVKAIFEVIDIARRDGHYKKSMIRNYKGNTDIQLLETIKKIVEIGAGMK